MITLIRVRGGFGEGDGGRPLPLRDFSPTDPMGSPFVVFWAIHFWLTDPIFFLKRLWRQYILIVRGSARRKKNDFLVNILQKYLKVLACFFRSFLQRRKLGQVCIFYCFGRARKINLVDQKKGRQRFDNFLKIRPYLREIPRSTPDPGVLFLLHYEL